MISVAFQSVLVERFPELRFSIEFTDDPQVESSLKSASELGLEMLRGYVSKLRSAGDRDYDADMLTTKVLLLPMTGLLEGLVRPGEKEKMPLAGDLSRILDFAVKRAVYEYQEEYGFDGLEPPTLSDTIRSDVPRDKRHPDRGHSR